MLAKAFGVPVGFSDHTVGVAVPLAAVALGACILEKHFTVDKALEGWDHAISTDPSEFAAIVHGARAVHDALGRSQRVLGAAEMEKRKAFRRRAVAARDLKRGSRLAAEDLEFKRPGTGIAPDEVTFAAGRFLTRDVAAEEELEWSDLG
jgi:N,N'-diacetyllegionaminate synthase